MLFLLALLLPATTKEWTVLGTFFEITSLKEVINGPN